MSDRSRATGKNRPERGETSLADTELLDSKRSHCAINQDETAVDPILSLRGLSKDIWTGEEADHYVKRVRG